MALTPFAFRLLLPLLPRAQVLAFGYPDLLVTPGEASQLVGSAVRPDQSGRAQAAHKQREACADTIDAFARAGAASFYCVDLAPSRGVETVVDLNKPLWPDRPPSYDLVIDAGTIEHCANVGQALMNAARMVAPGGHVFHSPPLSMSNHGFYNFSPTLLNDFYSQNGWEVLHLSGFQVHNGFESFEVPEVARFIPPVESALYFLARRLTVDELRWPVQEKYRRTS